MSELTLAEITNGVFDIEIPNFKKWNPDTRGKRQWFALSTSFYSDKKILQLSMWERSWWVHLLAKYAATRSDLVGTTCQLLSKSVGSTGQGPAKSLLKLSKLGLIHLRLVSLHNKTDITRQTGQTGQEISGDSAAVAASPPPPVPDLCEMWNQNCGTLPRCVAVNKTREKKWRSRWQEYPDREYWESTVRRLAASKFASGCNDRSWVATVDFLLQPEAHLKINEGKYDNRNGRDRPLNAELADRLERGEL